MWSGAPGGQGWAPNIFDANDPSNNSAINEPHLRGSIMVLSSPARLVIYVAHTYPSSHLPASLERLG